MAKQKLTPEQIAQILASQSNQFNGANGDGWRYFSGGQTAGGDGGDGGLLSGGGPTGFEYKQPGVDVYDAYDAQGNYLSSKADANKMTAADYLKFAALVSGVGALNGGLAGLGTAGTTASSAAPGSWLSQVPGMNALDIASVGAPGGAAAANLALPEIMAGTGAAAAGGGALGTAAASKGGLMDSITSGAGAVNKALGGNLGGLIGAAGGALSSQDQTSSKDPWAPAQDFIKQQIAQGQSLSQKYQDQPFSQQQQTSYNNIGGLLNAMNTMAPTMMQGFSNNASGANQFDLRNPRKSLLGTDVMNSGATWNPGLLNFFPGAK